MSDSPWTFPLLATWNTDDYPGRLRKPHVKDGEARRWKDSGSLKHWLEEAIEESFYPETPTLDSLAKRK